MHVSNILKVKGSDVITTGPDESISAIVRMLNDKRIGAVIVRDGAGAVVGIISERDIIRGIAVSGGQALDMAVRDFMTAEITGCTSDDTVAKVMKIMTVGRFRHVPVIDDGALKGIISIGDVVKHRLDETEMEARVLRERIMLSA